jgi:lipopolysaccharide/colanic/teichoic acid biosynthesis glycosyltransferase
MHQAIDIAEAVLFAELMIFGVLFTFTRLDGVARSIPLIHGSLLLVGLIGVRVLFRGARSAEDKSKSYRNSRQRTIIIGANRLASAFIRMLEAYASEQPPVVAILDDDAAITGQRIAGVRVLGAPRELDAIISEFAVHGVTVDRVVIAGEDDLLSPTVLQEIERVCKKNAAELRFLPRIIGLTEPNPSTQTVRPEPVQVKAPVTLPRYFWLKRWIDVIGSLVIIVLLFPLIIIASVIVLLDVGRPVLFWQERMGWQGRSFLIYKYRTISAPFDSVGNSCLTERKPSTIGRLLRITRIDELPQLLNVLLGDMSIIGPRPLLPEDQPADPSLRLSVRPGITGWAQVNGGKLLTKEEKETLDEWYIRNQSFWLDLRIAMMTIQMLVKSRTSSEETAADTEQVLGKNISFARSTTVPNVVAPGRPDAA